MKPVSGLKQLPLRYQITVATFLPLVVFALLAFAVGAYALRRVPEDIVLERQTALAHVAAAGVAGNLRGYVRLLETTAVELAQQDGAPSRQQQLLTDRAAVFRPFRGVGLLDERGTVIAVTPGAERALGLNSGEGPYFQEVKATGATIFTSVNVVQPDETPGVNIVVPVRRQGIFVGALVGQFTLQRPDWARDLNLLRTPEGGKAYLIDGASTIIFHPDPSRIGTSLQSDPALWSLVFAGQADSVVMRPSEAGPQLVVSYVPIPGINWGLVVEEPWEIVLAAIAPYQWTVSGLVALGIVVALGALVWSVGRVTRPLNDLVAAGRRVAEGRPYETIPVAGPPDLRVLIQVINSMVAHLTDQQAVLRRYAVQVLRGQEDERLRISHDLHDETVQDLVALAQRVELCADLLGQDQPAAQRQLAEVQDLAHKTLREVRRLSQNLRPAALEDLGLAAALQLLAKELGEQLPGTRVHCEIVGQEARLPAELELTAFRIAQEALSNVRRHAIKTTRVYVALIYEAAGIVLEVEDDGIGFAVAEREALARAGHLGLIGMAERAQLFGGTVRVVSAPGEGVTVRLHLPLGADDPAPV